MILALPGSAVGLIRDAVAPPPANPTSADQFQNIDQVKTAIKGSDQTFKMPNPMYYLP